MANSCPERTVVLETDEQDAAALHAQHGTLAENGVQDAVARPEELPDRLFAGFDLLLVFQSRDAVAAGPIDLSVDLTVAVRKLLAGSSAFPVVACRRPSAPCRAGPIRALADAVPLDHRLRDL